MWKYRITQAQMAYFGMFSRTNQPDTLNGATTI
jgi:hypothetical protein